MYSRDYMKKLASSEASMAKKLTFDISPEYFRDLVYEDPRPRPFEDPAGERGQDSGG